MNVVIQLKWVQSCLPPAATMFQSVLTAEIQKFYQLKQSMKKQTKLSTSILTLLLVLDKAFKS